MITDYNVTICGHGSGTPRLANLAQYSTNRYKQLAPNGVHKGIVAVRRLKELSDGGRARYQIAYKAIIGRNTYSQMLRQYAFRPCDGRYYSDCSSSQMAALQQAGYSVPLLNTAGIYCSGLFDTVPVKLKNGHITNPEVLKVGDQILFAGNDPSRPKQIGHVEGVYAISKNEKETYKPEVQPANFKAAELAGTYIVDAARLNLRYGAGTQYDVITTLHRADMVTCYGYYNLNDGTKWLYVVTADGTVGYASTGKNFKYLRRKT